VTAGVCVQVTARAADQCCPSLTLAEGFGFARRALVSAADDRSRAATPSTHPQVTRLPPSLALDGVPLGCQLHHGSSTHSAAMWWQAWVTQRAPPSTAERAWPVVVVAALGGGGGGGGGGFNNNITAHPSGMRVRVPGGWTGGSSWRCSTSQSRASSSSEPHGDPGDAKNRRRCALRLGACASVARDCAPSCPNAFTTGAAFVDSIRISHRAPPSLTSLSSPCSPGSPPR
jgi:hypothetical protein